MNRKIGAAIAIIAVLIVVAAVYLATRQPAGPAQASTTTIASIPVNGTGNLSNSTFFNSTPSNLSAQLTNGTIQYNNTGEQNYSVVSSANVPLPP